MIISKKVHDQRLKDLVVVKKDEFVLNGEKWKIDLKNSKNQGFSKRGIWTNYTNGEIVMTIYKSDLKKIDFNKASMLFHGI